MTEQKQIALSNKERVVCRLIGQGLGPSEIAKRLNLKVNTVETLRARARHKVGLHGRVFNVWCARNADKLTVDVDPFIDVEKLPPIPVALPPAPKRPIILAPDPDQLQAPGTPTMKLLTFVDVYASEHDIQASTLAQYRRAVTALEKFVGRQLRLCDVTSDVLNQHLMAMKDDGKSDSTRHSRRRDLTLLLRAAINRGDLVSFPFQRVVKVKVRDRIVRAWTPADVIKLLAIAETLSGNFSTGVPKALFWKSYILGAWDTGLRGCDLLAIAAKSIHSDGSCSLVQRKTGRRHRVFFQPAAMAAIRESLDASPRKLVWPLWGRREAFGKAARKLLKKAGLPGSLKWIRRASATAIEKDHPGCAGRHLGHKTPGLAEKSYIDFDQISEDRPLPRQLATYEPVAG